MNAAAASLRDARAALLADTALSGEAFGGALAALLDRTLDHLFPEATGRVALVALGSYARGELCPGSDVDVLLLTDVRGRNAKRDVRALAETLWYPLWDAGFVTGHAARTVKESLALADEELDALTALLEVRHVCGDAMLTSDLASRARDLARRRGERLLDALSNAADVRRVQPGPVAEMLEPDLKEGAGGLRDLQSLDWAGHSLGEPGGTGILVRRGFLTPSDEQRLRAARSKLLDIRVALHRVTGARGDRLLLQEQDAVAVALGSLDADALVRDLATSAREVAWITRDSWARLRDSRAGPTGRIGAHDRPLAAGVVLRDGRVALTDANTVSALRVLEAAAAAAEADAPFDRGTLLRLRDMRMPTWDVWERAAFLRLLRAGEHATPVFEALDHEGVLTRVLPEWEHVRSRPQRNAYHRYTVDRHLLEAVAECARLLDAAEGAPADFDGVVARACRRPELLLLAALLHDVGKGMPGDHSEKGAQVAATVARRIGLDSEGREILVWLVREHLLMADVATRRDLSDASIADGLADRCVGDAERLRLLYLLTIGDSLATGPAAWGSSKAALVRDLFVKAAVAIEQGEAAAVAADRRKALVSRLGEVEAKEFLSRLPEAYVLAFDDATMAEHRELLDRTDRAVVCTPDADAGVTVTVVARDRPGLLATVSGAMSICKLTVLEASLFGTTDGVAIDVFRATDPFGRFEESAQRVADTLERALDGVLDVASAVEERGRGYRRAGTLRGPVHVDVDLDASDTATIVEVHADDEVGLLYRVAATFTELGLDVAFAKVATLGARVVDVFYVRDAGGAKITDPDAIGRLRSALVARLSA